MSRGPGSDSFTWKNMEVRHQQNHQPGVTVLLILPNMFPLPGLARMYARDGVVTLRESPSTISSLVL